jgi:hypothetical protein
LRAATPNSTVVIDIVARLAPVGVLFAGEMPCPRLSIRPETRSSARHRRAGRQEAGVFRCRREIFANEDLFELEMKHIFESNWV